MIGVILAILASLTAGEASLTGYLCGKPTPNMTTVSLLKVEDCTLAKVEPESLSIPIQLLQKNIYRETVVNQCRIRVDQTIFYCGMYSHNSIVHGGQSVFMASITRDVCNDMIKYNQLKYGRVIINDIKPNMTNRVTITTAGKLSENGECEGELFVSGDREYKKSVVIEKLEISYSEVTSNVNNDLNTLILPSGAHCPYIEGHCISNDEQYAYWSVEPTNTCKFDQFSVLFEGVGIKVSGESVHSPTVYFGNSSHQIKFGLAATGEEVLCGYKLIKTEHPDLYIIETTPERSFAVQRSLAIADILLSNYFNAKLAYLEGHVSSEIKSLYRDIINHQCQLERQILVNSLAIVQTQPDIFALTLMKEQGYTAIPAGEAAHILQCEAINCKPRDTDQCYLELPVTCNEEPVFLKPRTRIIVRKGTPVMCNSLINSLFQINGRWRYVSRPAESSPPQNIIPMTRPTWAYKSIDDFIESGIYTQQDLKLLHEHTAFPIEKSALIESVAHRLYGSKVPSVNFDNLLDNDKIGVLIESRFTQLWNGFMKFGTVSAGILMIIIIVQLFKLLFDTLIRGYTLHAAYGCSAHLFGALFGTITNLLIHRRYNRGGNENNQPDPEDPPSRPVEINRNTTITSTMPVDRNARQARIIDIQRRILGQTTSSNP